MNLEFDDGDDLSTTTGTETLAASDLIIEEFAEGSDRSQLPKQRIGGRELKLDSGCGGTLKRYLAKGVCASCPQR